MHEWIEWARGPAFRFVILFMVLGLARALVLQAVAIRRILRQAGNRKIPARTVLRDTLRWLLPNPRVTAGKRLFAASSMVFHVAVIVTPLFLAGHILLWERGLGISWPALNQPLADYLTWAGIAAALILLSQRICSRASRTLSRPQDYLLLVLIGVSFTSGHLITRPQLNPFAYEPTLLVHVLSGDLVLLLVPFSKLSHLVLFPITQLVSELGWHLAPGAGSRVAAALHKEHEPV
jgi:nitrate reductase gamma subunit